jgi:hypothetical protein
VHVDKTPVTCLPLLLLLLLVWCVQLHINESSYLQLVEVQESMSYPGLLTQVCVDWCLQIWGMACVCRVMQAVTLGLQGHNLWCCFCVSAFIPCCQPQPNVGPCVEPGKSGCVFGKVYAPPHTQHPELRLLLPLPLPLLLLLQYTCHKVSAALPCLPQESFSTLEPRPNGTLTSYWEWKEPSPTVASVMCSQDLK